MSGSECFGLPTFSAPFKSLENIQDDQLTQKTSNTHSETDASTVSSSPSRRRNIPRRRNEGRTGRLWQLPQSSIQEYAAWIEQKPKDSQTPSEKRFLQKFQRRMLIRKNKLPAESMKHYVARLEAKDKISDVELKLIEQYHSRKAKRRAQRSRQDNNPFRGSIPPPIFWRRESSRKKSSPSPASAPLMANLQESMNRMGISCDKLRDMPMEDTKLSTSSMFQSNPFSL